MAFVEPVVHVRDEAASACRPALVLVMPYERNSPIRARVVRSSALHAVGIDDEEGVFPATDATWREAIVPGTGGERRRLDHWHAAINCPYG